MRRRNIFPKGKPNIFTRIMMVFIVLILPLYAFSLQVNISIQNKIRMEEMEFSRAKVRFYLSGLDNDMQEISRIQSELFSDSDLHQLVSLSVKEGSYDYYQCINRLRGKITELKNCSTFVDGDCVYIPSIRTKISDTILSELSGGEFAEASEMARSQTLPFFRRGDSYYILIGSTESGGAGAARDGGFVISVKISVEKVRNILHELTDAYAAAMLVGGKNGLDVVPADSAVAREIRDYVRLHAPATEAAELARLELPEGKYIVTYQRSGLLDSTLIVYEPEAALSKSLWENKILLAVMSALTLALVLAFSVWIRSLVVQPLTKLIRAFGNIGNGEFDVSIRYARQDEFGFLYGQFNEMFRRLRTLIQTVYEQKLCVKEAELKQLQYQINPHFLYNCILIVNNLIKMEDYDCAQKLTLHLGKYYQYITKNVTADVPLRKEYDHMLDYVGIQSIRFSNRVSARIGALPERFRELMVPKLILQPIVENAFQYGLKNKAKGGVLSVLAAEDPEFLRIIIEDNGDELTDGKLSAIRAAIASRGTPGDSSALANVNTRIRIKFGETSGLFASRGESGGLRVEVRLKTGPSAQPGEPQSRLSERKEELPDVQPADRG